MITLAAIDLNLFSKLDVFSAYPEAYVILLVVAVLAAAYFILRYVYLKR